MLLRVMEKMIEDYVAFVGREYINELYSCAARFKNSHLVMVNSIKNGGGVAELLENMVPFYEELGMKVTWFELNAPEDFYQATKSFHNALQGEEDDMLENKLARYQNFFEREVEELNKPLVDTLKTLKKDIVVVHDPQPCALVKYRKNNTSKWFWRKHIDTSRPNPRAWEYFYLIALKYDRIITSKENFIRGDRSRYHIIPPSINPLAEKNRDMAPEEIEYKLRQYGIPTDKPLVVQVSRFDKWKDPMGVIEAYNESRNRGVNCSLVMIGSFAKDDPEGPELHRQMEEYRRIHSSGEDIHLITVHDPLLVNAVQRAATVVLQKSLREGFALTVSEALWKRTPVIGTDAGGIPLQVQHNINGYVVRCYDIDGKGNPRYSEQRNHHIKEVADHICDLVSSKEKARIMGKNGREHVRNNFLITRKIRNYLELFSSL
jgi:trehalose synthase